MIPPTYLISDFIEKTTLKNIFLSYLLNAYHLFICYQRINLINIYSNKRYLYTKLIINNTLNIKKKYKNNIETIDSLLLL